MYKYHKEECIYEKTKDNSKTHPMTKKKEGKHVQIIESRQKQERGASCAAMSTAEGSFAKLMTGSPIVDLG